MTSANPETRFWHALHARRVGDHDALHGAHPGKPSVIFTGGSSCAFSIDPIIISEATGLPAFNYGGAARSGAKFLIGNALARCRNGDILVLALEPHFLTEPGREQATQLGMSLAIAMKDPELALGGACFDSSVSLRDITNLLRPGARYMATWIGKAARGDLSYRYTLDDYREGGRLDTSFDNKWLAASRALPPQHLTEEGKQLLREVVRIGNERNLKVIYALPWAYTESEHVEANRKLNRTLLDEIAAIVPVLEDPMLGAIDDRSLFSDTEYHLSDAGSRRRSEAVVKALVANFRQLDPTRSDRE
jgi:hypothetical protein